MCNGIFFCVCVECLVIFVLLVVVFTTENTNMMPALFDYYCFQVLVEITHIQAINHSIERERRKIRDELKYR